MFQTTGKFYVAGRCYWEPSCCAALAAWGYQLYYGFGVTGYNWPVYWAFHETNFVFWIGISHAGTLISAILRLVNATWRRPVTRCAEIITAFALMIGAMFPTHPPGQAVARIVSDSLSQRTRPLAELSVPSGLGLLRDQYVSAFQPAVPGAAHDSGFCFDSRSSDRSAKKNLLRV